MKMCARCAAAVLALLFVVCLCALPSEAADELDAFPVQWTEYGSEKSFALPVEKPGVYALFVQYTAFVSRSSFIELNVSVTQGDNTHSAEGVILERPLLVKPSRQNKQGNDIRGGTEPSVETVRRYLSAPEKPGQPWLLDLSSGTAEITITAKRADFLLESLSIVPWPELDEHSENSKQLSEAQECVVIQAENLYAVSDSTLCAQYDRSGPEVQPSDPGRLVLNIAGGENWNQTGQWLEWKAEVPDDGLYAIRIKARQNMKSGLASNRRLLVDGKVPFTEADNIPFRYSPNWQLVTLADSDGNELLLPLTRGEHTIRMEVVFGPTLNAAGEIQTALTHLNDIYRQIVMITGVNPDKNRDYSLPKMIPSLVTSLNSACAELETQMEQLEILSGQRQGDELTTLATLIHQLQTFGEEPDSIPLRLTNFKSNLDNLSTWLNTLSQQPLDLDCIYLDVPNSGRSLEKASFAQKALFGIKGLWASFFHDYDTTSANEDAQLTVWVGSGRDQMQILQRMIDEQFTPHTGISVKVSMVQQGVAEAILAGEGPDAVFYTPSSEPANLAMRGALEPLDGYPGFQELQMECQKEAFIPYQYDGMTYGVPFTQQFPMLFYRTDIFGELGIEAPKTWKELYGIIPVLQRKNLQVGIPSSEQTFATLLFQQGGTYYNEDKTKTALRDNRAVDTFRQYTRLFSDYDLPLAYDFFNRFCSGEMPLAIADYTEYNRLVTAAPELTGLWKMVPVPGTEQADGTIRREVLASGGQGGYILKTSEYKQEAWELLRWFSSAEAQAEFGKQSEAVMGSAGRYPAANQVAFEQLPWLADEQEILFQQWNYVKENPQPPGSYYMQRNMTNAFRQVVLEGENPREMLGKYMNEVDREIQRKWTEYRDINHG